MNFDQHPDDELLQAYQQEPAADRFIEVSLHLASCADCRQQLARVQNLRSIYRYIESETLSDEQQQRVEEFTQQSLSEEDYAAARDEIRNNPGMLKSALYSLSMPQDVLPHSIPANAPDNENSFMSQLIEWFNWPTPAWAGFAAGAVITLTVSVLLLGNSMLQHGATSSINIASYQDSKSMRFIPQQTVPGIGFFSAANNYAKPYDNLLISVDDDHQLQMQWQPVDNATQYQISVYRFSDGDKQLVEKVTTRNTYASIQLQLESFNQRFEWTLSGNTSQQEVFITSGGFVIGQ